MSSQSSSSSLPVLKTSDFIDLIACLLSDTDDVLASLERRFRPSDVTKLVAYAAAISHAVEQLSNVPLDSLNQDLPLVDDQSLGEESQSDLDEEERC